MLVTWAEKKRKNLPKEDIKYEFGQKKVWAEKNEKLAKRPYINIWNIHYYLL